MLAYVLASETLRIANRRAGRHLFTWETRSAVSGPVAASNGREVLPDVSGWADTVDADLVVVMAGYEPLAVRPQGLRSYLSRAARRGAILGGVDTGALLLASLGLLPEGTRVVLHRDAHAELRAAFPEIAVDDGIYALDGRILSAAGGTATGDAMLAWISGQVSPAFAEAVAEDMAHGSIRPSADPQSVRGNDDPVLRAMRHLMLAHLDHPLGIGAIADSLGLSGKALRGRCLRLTGQTPSALYLRTRLSHARDLLHSTALTVTEIAFATGFGTHASFSRSFRAAYGETPSSVRKEAFGAVGPALLPASRPPLA
ncbi:GlxA family transcriptional regulator [Rhodobacter sp. NTK016B]|uniref:GlxA family transcriptional regulator n=1 Tax=Rhodobacter sp. NTK016B TaxID=2759676 RepID=UPI002570A2F6|nr:helix-turn-helix domain-containing protein [Rhodobacter sp. NTK016B]